MAPVPTKAPDWRHDIEGMTNEFMRSLPAQMPTERFVRTILTAVQINPDLAKANRHSLKVACMKAAQDGLLPDGREGALVPYAGQVQWMPMVWGLMKKARNSGEIASITGHVVYRHDRFKLRFGDEECLEHEPGDVDDKELVEANAIGAYAIAKLKDGTIVRAWRSRAQIMLVKTMSKAAKGPMWTKFWEEAWIKTAIRYLSKYLPSSTDKEGVDTFARAAARDDELTDFNNARDVTPGAAEKRSHLEKFVETKQAVAEAAGGNGHDDEGSYDPETGEVSEAEAGLRRRLESESEAEAKLDAAAEAAYAGEPAVTEDQPELLADLPTQTDPDPLKVGKLSAKDAVSVIELGIRDADAAEADRLLAAYRTKLERVAPKAYQALTELVTAKIEGKAGA